MGGRVRAEWHDHDREAEGGVGVYVMSLFGGGVCGVVGRLVKSAASFALNSGLDVTKDRVVPKSGAMTKDSMMVTMEHFQRALLEVKPAFGVEEEELKKYLRGGFINYGVDFDRLLDSCKTLLDQVRTSPRTPLLSVLLSGTSGCGKTALATYLSMSSGFPFVKLITAEDMIGWGALEKAGKISKVRSFDVCV
jgi:vesicle-fusing ATPase